MREVLIPIIPTLAYDELQHLSDRIIRPFCTTLAHHMMSTRSQLSSPHPITNNTRKLETELTAIIREPRIRAIPCRDVTVHDKVDRSEGGKFKSGYKVQRGVLTETVRDKQGILVPGVRGRIGTEVMERDRSARDIKHGDADHGPTNRFTGGLTCLTNETHPDHLPEDRLQAM